MEQLLICMSLSLIAGLLASRAAKAVRLPAVTSYLVAGLLLGPFFLGRLGLSGWGFGFGSLAQVESYGIINGDHHQQQAGQGTACLVLLDYHQGGGRGCGRGDGTQRDGRCH